MSESRISILGAGAVIRDLRESAGLSGSCLGEMVGVSRSMISKYENNGKALSIVTIEKFADALGQPADQVVTACLKVAFPAIESSKLNKTLRVIVDELVGDSSQ